jgi:hypothetical protein
VAGPPAQKLRFRPPIYRLSRPACWLLASRYAGDAKPGNESLDECIVAAEEEFLAGELSARFPDRHHRIRQSRICKAAPLATLPGRQVAFRAKRSGTM